MLKQINSVLGPISTEKLGFTLMHEHFLIADWSMRHAFPDWIIRDEVIELAVALSRKAKSAGVETIVDMTPINLGRDICLIREISEKSQMQVIAATGLYYNEEPWLDGKDVHAIADLFVREIADGIEGTNIKAGIIKCATDHFGFTEINRKLLRASALASKATGIPIYTHTIANMRMGLTQQDIFESEGVNLERVVIGHCGDTGEMNYLETILKRGSYIGLDRFGSDGIYPFEKRIMALLELCKRGWTDKILLSHDQPCFYDFGENSWSRKRNIPLDEIPIDFCYISNKVIPELLKNGISSEQIKKMTVDNPKHFFEQIFTK